MKTETGCETQTDETDSNRTDRQTQPTDTGNGSTNRQTDRWRQIDGKGRPRGSLLFMWK